MRHIDPWRQRAVVRLAVSLLVAAGPAACASDAVDIASIHPQDALAAGVSAADGDDDREAVALLTHALDSGELNETAQISALLWRARAFNDLGDFRRAVDDVDAVLAIDDENAEAFATRGRALLSMQDFDGAVFDFDSALALDPANRHARFYRGVTFLRTGDDGAALADFTASLRLDPKDAAAYKNRGFALLRVRNYRLAAADFSSAIALTPDDDVGYFFRGFAKYFAGDYRGAARDFEVAAAQPGPDNDYDLLAAYLALARSDSPAGATAWLRDRAAERDGAWPAPLVRLMLGEVTPDQARAAAVDPDQAVDARRRTEADYHAGQFYLLNGDRQAAMASFRSAVSHDQLDHIAHVGALVELARLRATVQ